MKKIVWIIIVVAALLITAVIIASYRINTERFSSEISHSMAPEKTLDFLVSPYQ